MSREVYSMTIEDQATTIYKGKTWISLLNTGDTAATIKCYNDDETETANFPLPSGNTFSFDETGRTNKEWGRVIVDATGTKVYAVFEGLNNPR